ncbi:MAG TPA: chemotaxis protein CheW, partial [Candidatus Melainabacteria bacterium]|nr:chemotaxis protein CheW [Candidatus Melainabacteria bacterium]
MANQVLIFNLGPHRACMELEDAVQVYDSVSFEEIGDVDPAVLGIINIRGQSVPLIDIKPRWNQLPRSVELSDQIVVFKSRGITVSIIVDKV